MSLFISVNTPSKYLEKTAIDQAITVLAANVAVEKRNGHLPKGPALDITFMLPSKNEAPPFKGMRMGGYSHENQTLFFESSVPEHIISSKDAPRYIAIALQDVVDNASEFFKNSNIRFDDTQWHRAIIPLITTASVLAKTN